MNAEDNIKKLTEMGFSEDQADKALKITKNDVESAIAYLFEDPIEIDTPNKDNQVATYEDSINVLNPGEIPDLSQYQGQTQPYVSDTREINYKDGRYDEFEEGMNYDEYIEGLGDECIYDDILAMKKDGKPPVILSKKSGFLENFYIPLITVLSQLAQFRSLFMKPIEHDYQYDLNWAIGKPQGVSLLSELDALEKSAFKFMSELQKVIGYLNGSSDRAFISGDNLIANLPTDIKKRLINSKIDTVDELLPKLFESLQNNRDELLGPDNAVDKLFKSSVESINEEVTNNIYTFDIDIEYRHKSMYESFNELFWGADLELLGNVRLIDTADLLTIQVIGDEDSFNDTNIQLNEFFYPEIYNSVYYPIIEEMNSKRTEIIKDRNSLSNQIMHLNSFEGKKVKGFLDASIKYLEKEDNDVLDLSQLSDEIASVKTQFINSLDELNELYSSLDVRNHENILRKIYESGIKFPTKYVLLGIILSDSEFYYKLHDSNTWIYQKARYSANNVVTDYDIDELDFETIQQDILQYTATGTRPLLLIYVSSNILDEEVKVENSKVDKFFDEDNSQFKKQIAEIEADQANLQSAEQEKESSESNENIETLVEL